MTQSQIDFWGVKIFNIQVATGEQKFILKKNETSPSPTKDQTNRKYREYKFCLRVNDEDWLEEPGFTDVVLSESMMADLHVNTQFRDEVLSGRKKIVGKLS